MKRLTRKGRPDRRHGAPRGRCLNCAWWFPLLGYEGLQGMCRGIHSAWKDKSVQATNRCGAYRKYTGPATPGRIDREAAGEDKATK